MTEGIKKRKEQNFLKIIIVEDEIIIARDIKQALEKAGYIVVKMFNSGEIAAKEIPQLNADLVIMDVFLKGKLDGIDAAEAISSSINIPFVFITGENDQSIIPRLKYTEHYGIVHKPFSSMNLLTSIQLVYKNFSGPY